MKLNKLLTGIVCLASCGAAFASPLSTATYNLFSSEADDIQSVKDYSSVEFDKYIASANFTSDTLNLGGAFKFKGIFFSPWYKGYIVNSGSTSSDSKTFTDVFDDSGNLTSETVTDKYYRSGTDNVSSTFSLLIGLNNFSFGPLGIKLGYSNAGTSLYKGTYLGSYSESTGTTETVTDEDGNEVSSTASDYDDNGYIGTIVNTPSVLAGTVIKVGDYTFKPTAGLTVNISDNTASGKKSDYSTPSVDTESTTKKVEYDNYTIGVKPVIGTSVNFPKTKNGFEHSASLSYEPNFRIYDYNGDKGTKTDTYKLDSDGTVTTTNKVEGTKYDYDSSSAHDVYVGYTLKYVMDDKVTVKAAYNADFTFNFNKYSTSDVTKTTTTTTDLLGNKSSTYSVSASSNCDYDNYSFALSHSVCGALQYHVLPSKLDFNFGAKVTLPTLNYSDNKSVSNPSTSYTKTTPASGSETEASSTGTSSSSSESESFSYTSAVGYACTGLTWFLNKNVILDSALSLGINGSNSTVFSGSLNLGCTLKF